MGYVCPVCETRQPDGEHLAHHLAITAMLHADAHESWLEEHAPSWDESAPAELAGVIVQYAEAAQHPEPVDETMGRGRPNVGGGARGRGNVDDRTGGTGPAAGIDAVTEAAIRKARELSEDAGGRATDANTDCDVNNDDGGEEEEASTDSSQ